MRAVGVALFLGPLVAACSTPVPATVTWGPSMALDLPPTVFVTASEQAPRVQQSLKEAGMIVVSSVGDANYWLRVDVGSSRGSRACGKTANVRYILNREQARALVVKGRGATGSCSRNVFDDMSRRLESYFEHRAAGAGRRSVGSYAALRASDARTERPSR